MVRLHRFTIGFAWKNSLLWVADNFEGQSFDVVVLGHGRDPLLPKTKPSLPPSKKSCSLLVETLGRGGGKH